MAEPDAMTVAMQQQLLDVQKIAIERGAALIAANNKLLYIAGTLNVFEHRWKRESDLQLFDDLVYSIREKLTDL